MRAGGILQILQSDWFREQAEFSDHARSQYDSALSGIRGKTWSEIILLRRKETLDPL